MLAGPTTPLYTMCKAVARTCNTLEAASAVDIDRTAEDRAFFAAEAAKLSPLRDALVAKHRAIEDFELGPGDVHQTSVELGDEVLDRGVRSGNARTKLGLKNQSGLGANHVFGNRIDELTSTPHRQEPGAVRGAIGRLDDVPDFDDKAKVKADLMARVELQEGLLEQRDNGHTQLGKLESEGSSLSWMPRTRWCERKRRSMGDSPVSAATWRDFSWMCRANDGAMMTTAVKAAPERRERRCA